MAFFENPECLSGVVGVQQQPGQPTKVELGMSILHTGTTSFAWAVNYRNLQIPWPHAYMFNSNMPYDCAREITTRSLLPYQPKWIFSLDTDVLVPPEAVIRLVQLAEEGKKDIVSGLYWAKKREPFNMPAAWIEIGQNKEENKVTYAAVDISKWLDQNALISCDVVGAGCLLVRAEVFQKLDKSNPNKPYFGWGLGRKDEATGKPLLQMCALPGQSVLGGSKIEDIISGEQIPSADGQLNKVAYVTSRMYDGGIVEILPSIIRLPIKVTSNHKILILRGMKRKYLFNYNKKKQKTSYDKKFMDLSEAQEEWRPSSELKKGDYVSFPILTDEKDIKEILFNNHPYSHLKDKVIVDEKVMEFLGWYAAEGCTSISKHSWQINFSFGRHERKYVDAIQKTLKETFGLNSHIIDSEKYHALSVRASGKELAIRLKEWFGTDATVKTIPNWILYLPKEKIYPFLRAFWLGDGYKTYAGTYKHDVLGTNIASKELALGIVALLIKIGIRPTLRHYKQHPTAMGKDIYVIKIGADSEKMTKLLNLPYNISKRKQTNDRTFFYKNKMWMPISDVKKSSYCGIVHDLRVEPNNSYILEGMIVHNSEDFYFCYRAKTELGIVPHLATSVKCGHVCTVQKRPQDGNFELI